MSDPCVRAQCCDLRKRLAAATSENGRLKFLVETIFGMDKGFVEDMTMAQWKRMAVDVLGMEPYTPVEEVRPPSTETKR